MAASTSSQPHTNVSRPLKPEQRQGNYAKSKKGKAKRGQPANSKHPQNSSQSDLWSNWQSCSTWDWTPLIEPSLTRASPVFTKDGNYFFALVGSSVKIHSTVTGKVVSTLIAPQEADISARLDTLTAAVINPHNPFQLITSSLNGRIRVWDFLDAILLHTVDIAQPIHFICAHENFKDSVFVAASRSSKKSAIETDAAVLHVSLSSVAHDPSTPSQKPPAIFAIGKIRCPTGLSISSNGAWLVAAAGHKIYVAKTLSLSSGFTKYVSPEKLTCLVFHPSEEYFATGDEKGVIRLWYCLNDDLAVGARGVEKRTQTTSLHWHAHAVSSITFTPNGAYLLSGGEEAVLVVWQLHTGKKEFVPRVGAPITSITIASVTSGEEEYMLGLADSTFLFIKSSVLKISRSFCLLKIDPSSSYSSPSTSKLLSTPLAVHSLTSTLVLPSSHPSSLQVYSPSASTLLSEIEISPSNRVSRREDKAIEPSRVEQAVLSSSGLWMATIDSREADDSPHGDLHLKIWAWDCRTSNWNLNTRIDRPHGTTKVTDIGFSPVNETQAIQLVTTGEDGYIKIWRLRSRRTDNEQAEEYWISRSTFAFRSATPRSISWSSDASLLAIALGPYVALCDPVTATLRHTLISSEGQSLQFVLFVGSGRYLVAAGEQNLILWDLVLQSIQWHCEIPLPISSITAHPQEDSFAIMHRLPTDGDVQGSRISIYNVHSPTPSHIYSLPFVLRNAVLYSSSFQLTFVGITQEWSIVMFGDEIYPNEGPIARSLDPFLPAVKRRSLFQDIFGSSAFAEMSSIEVQEDSLRAHTGFQKMENLLDAPAYLTLPLHTLFEPFIGTHLRSRLKNETLPEENANDDDVEDVEMDDESSAPAIHKSQSSRLVGQDELELLTNLFRKNFLPVPPTLPKVNSKRADAATKINGVVHPPSIRPKVTGTQKQHASDLKNGNLSASASPVPVPIMNGKKRKKSME